MFSCCKTLLKKSQSYDRTQLGQTELELNNRWQEAGESRLARELLIPLVTDCRRYKSSWNEAALLAVLCSEQMFPKICLHDGCIDSEIFEKKDFYLKVLFFHNQSFFSFTFLNISICVLVFSCIRNSEMKKRKQFTICQVYRSKMQTWYRLRVRVPFDPCIKYDFDKLYRVYFRVCSLMDTEDFREISAPERRQLRSVFSGRGNWLTNNEFGNGLAWGECV